MNKAFLFDKKYIDMIALFLGTIACLITFITVYFFASAKREEPIKTLW